MLVVWTNEYRILARLDITSFRFGEDHRLVAKKSVEKGKADANITSASMGKLTVWTSRKYPGAFGQHTDFVAGWIGQFQFEQEPKPRTSS